MTKGKPLSLLPRKIEDLIFASYEVSQYTAGRRHMGASGIGRPCEREIWLSFRWVMVVRFLGRILRLFDTGNLEEPRMTADLRRIGCTVLDVDPGTGRQWTVRDETGHFGGSMDAILKAPLPILPTRDWYLGEFKTHSAKSFRKLEREGVEKSKPEHFDQMQSYMALGNLDGALYLAKNKDNDDLYSEIVPRDKAAGERILKKAKRLINMPSPPDRPYSLVKGSPCNWCDFKSFCYDKAWPERNCRTCLHSTPAANGTWTCSALGDPVDIEGQTHCVDDKLHRFIPTLVPGEQVDLDGSNVVYMVDGEKWVDAGKI